MIRSLIKNIRRKNTVPQKVRPASAAGFTLIELLVVIAIIGLLSSIVMSSLNSARVKARDAKRIADLRSIRVALRLYLDDFKQYPTNGYWTCSHLANWTALQTSLAPYISSLPKDPRGTGYPWTTGLYSYCYGRISTDEYDLVTQLEDRTNSNRCQLRGWLFRNPNPDISWCGSYSPYIYTDH